MIRHRASRECPQSARPSRLVFFDRNQDLLTIPFMQILAVYQTIQQCPGLLDAVTPVALHRGNEHRLSRNQYNGFVYFALDVIEQRRMGGKFVFFFDKLLLHLRSSCRIKFRAEPVAEVPDVVDYTKPVHMTSERKCALNS